MVTIEICIGSSCFVKGSNEVVELLKNYIAEHHLEEKVQRFLYGTVYERSGY